MWNRNVYNNFIAHNHNIVYLQQNPLYISQICFYQVLENILKSIWYLSHANNINANINMIFINRIYYIWQFTRYSTRDIYLVLLVWIYLAKVLNYTRISMQLFKTNNIYLCWSWRLRSWIRIPTGPTPILKVSPTRFFTKYCSIPKSSSSEVCLRNW